MDTSATTIYRRPDDSMVAGVCAGLAHQYDIDVSLVRAVFVGLTVFSGFGLAAYIALWLLLDPPPDDLDDGGDEATSEEEDDPNERFRELSQQPIVKPATTPTEATT